MNKYEQMWFVFWMALAAFFIPYVIIESLLIIGGVK